MHRLAVSICANTLVVSALALAACAPETAPTPKSSPSSQRASSATTTTPAGNTQGRNTTPPVMDPPFVMRTSTGNAAQAGAPGAMRSASGSGGEAAPRAQAAGASAPVVPSAGAAGAATSPAGAAGAPSAGNAECSALATCCAALTDEDDREDCEEIVERDNAERCTRASEDACQSQGMPTMPTMPTTAAMQGEACTKLSTCCGTLQRRLQQEDCQEDAMRRDDERCTRQLQRTCPELGPPPREPACVTLQACCPMLTDRALESCRRALQEDEERDCTEASMELCQ